MTDSERIAEIEGREKAGAVLRVFNAMKDWHGHIGRAANAASEAGCDLLVFNGILWGANPGGESWSPLGVEEACRREPQTHARADIPWLLERVRGLEAELKALAVAARDYYAESDTMNGASPIGCCDGKTSHAEGCSYCAAGRALAAVLEPIEAAAEQARGGEERT